VVLLIARVGFGSASWGIPSVDGLKQVVASPRAVRRSTRPGQREYIDSQFPKGGERAGKLSLFRRVIARVPRGRVITYGAVAEAAGHPGAARLTVWALQAGTGLPWHRVVASGGRIALPGESGREQRLRLELEGITFRGSRVRMELHGWVPRRRGPPTEPKARGRRESRPPWERSAKGG
jgi:methylated-DNA-protein-cysteine methyltransferase related protein